MQHMCIYNTYKHHHKVPVKQMNTVVYIKYQHNIRLEFKTQYYMQAMSFRCAIIIRYDEWGRIFYININPCADIGLRDGKT